MYYNYKTNIQSCLAMLKSFADMFTRGRVYHHTCSTGQGILFSFKSLTLQNIFKDICIGN